MGWENIFYKFRWQITFVLIGLALIGGGILLVKSDFLESPKIEILENEIASPSAEKAEIVFEVSGEVEKPGVYKLPAGSRVEDALVAAGGISADADRNWIEKNINRAGKLIDGQKIYIAGKQSEVLSAKESGGNQIISSGQVAGLSNLVNINSATGSELVSLWGIGPVTAQKIIEQRPYSSVEELLTKKILKKNVYDRIKDLITVY